MCRASTNIQQIFNTPRGKLIEGVPGPHDCPLSSPEKIQQLDGNDSICLSNSSVITNIEQHNTALTLPIIATYNLRSLLPKVKSLKTDLIEREIDLAFLQEIWEDSGNEKYQFEVEKMFEENGLLYRSSPRPKRLKLPMGVQH